MPTDQAPAELREGVRSGILAALDRDTELRGGRTARLLAAAGVLGVFGTIGMIQLLSGHPYGHHPSSHAVTFTAIWSALLVVALALVFLQVRTPSMSLARAACVGVVGLGIAGVCSTFCPDQHFLSWWISTPVGNRAREIGDLWLSALCFGAVTTLVFGAASAIVALGGRRRGPIGPVLPALMLLLLLAPGVALQAFGTSVPVLIAWFVGTGVGAYLGVAGGIIVRDRFFGRNSSSS